MFTNRINVLQVFFRSIFLVIFSLFVSILSFSQCGTETPKTDISDYAVINSESKSTITYNLNKTLSVNVYTVANDFESYNFSYANYAGIWDELNVIFEPIGLSFELCTEDSIPNYNYDILDREPDPVTGFSDNDEMLNTYGELNVINVYYVEDIPATPTQIAANGFAYFPGGRDVIVLRKSSGINTLAHEMGHFFGLYHTFETDFGFELVDGSNCETTGDFVCDTPADNNGQVANCQFQGPGVDANADFYTPYLSNYMSYYGNCRCQFTNEQYNRMAWHYLNQRNHLW